VKIAICFDLHGYNENERTPFCLLISGQWKSLRCEEQPSLKVVMKIAPSQHGSSGFRFAMVAGFAGIFFSMSPWCRAQSRETLPPTVPIPKREVGVPRPAPASLPPKVPIPEREVPVAEKGFKTWSIFLVTNQQWLLRETSDRLERLYENFTIFGDAIGPENLAVWFWSQPPQANQSNKTVDVERSVAFCRSINLRPSQGPYVVVMREYPGKCIVSDPDSFPKKSVGFLVIKLNGTDATKTGKLLDGLVDQLTTADLSKSFSREDDYWNGWRNVLKGVSNQMLGLSSKVTAAFGAGPNKTEFKLGP